MNPDLDTWAVVFRDGSTLSGMRDGQKVRYPAERREEMIYFAVGGYETGVAPVDYRKRVKIRSDGVTRWCHVLVYEDRVAFIHDDRKMAVLPCFLEGSEWYYPISHEGISQPA